MKIVLTGFMGTGKSVVGKMLAEQTGFGFLDTDQLIEERTGLAITDIFNRRGEAYFRSVEKKVVADVSRKDRVVIACGGGAILDPENFRRLAKNGVLVALTASAAEIEKRTGNNARRPMIDNTSNRKETILKLLEKREPSYRKAHLSLDTTGKDPAEVTRTLLKMLKREYPALLQERG